MKLKTEEVAVNENDFDAGKRSEDETTTEPGVGSYIRTATDKEQCISNLEFIKEQYQSQLIGIDRRFYNVKVKLLSCCLTESALLIVMFWLITVGTRLPEGFSLFAYVGVGLAMFYLYKNNKELINAIVSYGVHYEKRGFRQMKIKYNVFTLGDERKHCEKELAVINHMLEELRQNGTNEVDRKYWDYEYVDKYAFTEVNDFYQRNYGIITVISVIIFFVVLVRVAGLVLERLILIG